MAKEKLFTPEDFDKKPKSPKKNTIKWIVGVIVVIAAAIMAILGIKGCSSNNKSTSSDANDANVSTSEIVKDSNVDTANVEEVPAICENVSQASEITASYENEINSPQEAKVSSKPTVAQPNHVPASDVETEALKVIRGDYGNSPERKNALGDKYEAIQNRVNQLKRQGVF